MANITLTKQHRFLTLLAGLTLILLVLSGCQTKTTTKHHGITVVSSLNFYGETAKAVLGDHGTVHTIVTNPNSNPHDFEPTTKTARTVAQADLVLMNGLGYDDWMAKLVAANDNQVATLNVGKDIWHKKAGSNEHLWYQQQTMPKLARRLAKVFSKQDPKHRKAYQRNAKHYIQSLKPLQAKRAQLKQNSHQQRVAVSEPVFNYALTALGYRISNPQFAQAIEEGTDPSPAQIKALQTDIKQHKIAFFVENKQSDDQVIKNLVSLAKQHHVPVLKVTETLPQGLNYQQWMLQQYQQLAKIQQKQTQ